MADVGLSFAPTAQNLYNQGQRGGGISGNVSPVQDAIKILSFRQPTVLGSSAPVPQSIFGTNAPTAQGGQIGGGIAENLLRMLFGGQMTGGIPSPFGLNPQSNTLAPTPLGGTPLGPPSSGLPASVIFHEPRPDSGGITGGPSTTPPPPSPGTGGISGGGGRGQQY